MVRLKEIDALRGVAACGVAFIFHLDVLQGVPRTGPLDGLPVFTWLYAYGWTLVDLFFVLSGYVFSHVYSERGKLKDGVTATEYSIARFARIYPLHFATLLLCVLLPASGRPGVNDLWHFVLNIFMLQESGLNQDFSYNFPAWSLSAEVLCYILFFVFAKRGWLLPFAIVVVPIFAVATIWGDSNADHIYRGIVGFFAGCLIFEYRWKAAVPMMMFGVLLMLSEASYGVELALAAFAPLVLLAHHISLLRHRVALWLGDLSLGIYLLHAPVYIAFREMGFTSNAAIPFAWIAIIGLSQLSFVYFEKPSRLAIRTFGKNWSHKPVVASRTEV